MNHCKRVFVNWFLVGMVGVAFYVRAWAKTVQWPTPNNALVEGNALEELMQPAAAGKVKSGIFGCVRNNGSHCH